MPETDTTLTQGEIFDLLSNARRRYVLYYLSRHDGAVDIGDLAAEVAAWENDTAVDEVERQERKRVYVSLYQTHVPKMAEAGLLEYDPDAGTVAITRQVSELTPYLEDNRDERSWYRYYLAVAFGSAILYGATVLDVPLFAALSETLVGGVVLAAFVALTLAYYIHERRGQPRLPPELIRK